MLNRSARWDDYVQESHTVVTRVEAWQGDQYTVLNVLDGSGTWAYNDSTRGSYDFRIIDPKRQTYQNMYSQIDVKKTRFVRYHGIKYPDGTTEYILCGTFYAQSALLNGEHHGDPVYNIKTFDASFRCSNPLAVPYFVPAGQKIADAVPAILTQKLSSLKFNLASTPWLTPALLISDDMDPWAQCRKMYANSGFDLYLERNDVVTSRERVYLPTQTYVWDFHEGPGGNIWNVERETADDDYPNVIRVIGTNPGVAGISGLARDEDPSSPTYYRGDYGERVRTYRSEIITLPEQANEAAKFYLARDLGPQDKVTFEALPNPTLEVGDSVICTSIKNGLNKTPLIVGRIDLPDGPSNMKVEGLRGVDALA